MGASERTQRLLELLPASRGAGRYLQRDYWAVIDQCRVRPSELMQTVRERFGEFSPAELARFEREPGETGPLRGGEELWVHIPLTPRCAVRVVHTDAQSLTLATLPGHPEAGRITFGAYRNARGDVVFHIRSRARSGSRAMFAGFLAVGESMQTNTWTDFVSTVASTFGSGLIGPIHAETQRLARRTATAEDPSAPTFRAEGD
ncbi:MAG TPA: DUF1990 family protein [Polyangiaceae bacterium]|nr:DUF1990 family protein [Polyangiaceae bacterium]